MTPTSSPWENIVEDGVAHDVPVAVASGLEAPTSGAWPHFVVCDGLALPFRSHQFDLVLSNAVVEHVGGQPAQAQLFREHDRVGRAWIATTPNRWFPVEAHTGAFGRHWSAAWRQQRTEFTRLLSRRELRRLAPERGIVRGAFFSPTLALIGGEGVAPLHRSGWRAPRSG